MAIDWKHVAKVAAASVAGGALAGTVAELVISKMAGRRCDEMEEYEELAEEYALDIPEGVNEPDDDELMRKVDTSAVDYTKFHGRSPKEEADPDGTATTGTYVISEEEFVRSTGNLDGYVTVTGTWFPDDGVLAGWNDELEAKDVAETVGEAAISKFDDTSVTGIYVRNDSIKVLFEIVRGTGSYEGALEELDG